jgi:hypothetical protein
MLSVDAVALSHADRGMAAPSWHVLAAPAIVLTVTHEVSIVTSDQDYGVHELLAWFLQAVSPSSMVHV